MRREGATRASLRGARVALAILALAASCGGGEGPAAERVSRQRTLTPEQSADSARMAGLAREALARHGVTDSLVVVSFTRGANGYLLELAPAADPAGEGGGKVWVDEDGSVTVMQEYRP